MLGETQKRWFIDKITGSNRQWQIWGNETLMYR
jgi:phosphodiesterase/alkaline phosphatase D-like protein